MTVQFFIDFICASGLKRVNIVAQTQWYARPVRIMGHDVSSKGVSIGIGHFGSIVFITSKNMNQIFSWNSSINLRCGITNS